MITGKAKAIIPRGRKKMRNSEVVAEYIDCSESEAKTKHLFVEKEVLYSYGYHFPLCVKLRDAWIINSNGYSKTTACHRGLVTSKIAGLAYRYLERAKKKGEHEDIILMDTEEMQRLIVHIYNTLNRKPSDISLNELMAIRMLINLKEKNQNGNV